MIKEIGHMKTVVKESNEKIVCMKKIIEANEQGSSVDYPWVEDVL